MGQLTLLWVYIVFTVSVSFICSLLEAALLAAPVAALESESGSSRGIRLLHDLKTNRIDDALSAILTLNTIANTMGAVMVGTQAENWAEENHWDASQFSGIVAASLALVILTVSEIIPKTLGAVYARSLANFVGYVTHGFTVILKPALLATRLLTRLLTRHRQVSTSKGELAAVIALATQEGVLERDERRLYDNLLSFSEIRVSDVMTPRTVAVMVPDTMTVEEFLNDRQTKSFSRIPVFENADRDEVLGYVLQTDVLRARIQGAESDKSIREFVRSIWYIPQIVSIRDALNEFLKSRKHMAMVTDEHGGVSGLITLEDIMETVLGVEILDESDRIADLRMVAVQLKKQRFRELVRNRELEYFEELDELSESRSDPSEGKSNSTSKSHRVHNEGEGESSTPPPAPESE